MKYVASCILLGCLTFVYTSVYVACGGKDKSRVENPVSVSPPVVAPEDAPATYVPPPPQELTFPTGEVHRKTQPAPGKDVVFRAPDVTSFRLPSGPEVYLVERHQLPTVTMQLVFYGGSQADPKGKEGRAKVCADLQSESTQSLTKVQLAERMADFGGGIWSAWDADSHTIGMKTLSKNISEMGELYAQVLKTPGFRQEDFVRIVSNNIASIQQSKLSPSGISNRLSDFILFGRKDPRSALMTQGSLQKLTVDDCKVFHKKAGLPGRARLYVVGDITKKDITTWFAQTGWKGKGMRRKKSRAPSPKQGEIFFVHVPGAAQTTISVVQRGPQRKTKRFFGNTLLANALSGGFSSRMNMNLREQKGYTYGARGSFYYTPNFGLYFFRTSVRTNATAHALSEVLREMQEMKMGVRPVTDSEVERERSAEILGLAGRFATGRSILDQYKRLVVLGLPMTTFDSFQKGMLSVKQSDVQKAARRLLQPKRARILVVGDKDAEQVFPGREKTKLLSTIQEIVKSGIWGKRRVVVIDADGKRIAP